MDDATKKLLNHAFKHILEREVQYVADRVTTEFKQFIELSGLKVPVRVETRLNADWFDMSPEQRKPK